MTVLISQCKNWTTAK